MKEAEEEREGWIDPGKEGQRDNVACLENQDISGLRVPAQLPPPDPVQLGYG